jgi:hypothetical protein
MVLRQARRLPEAMEVIGPVVVGHPRQPGR